MRRDFASVVIIAGAVSVLGWGVWLLKHSAPAEDTVSEQVVNATARDGQSDADGSRAIGAVAGAREAAEGPAEVGRQGSGGLGAETNSLPTEEPGREAGDILITVAPEADDGSGEFQELTLEQVRDTIRITRQDLAVSTPVIDDLEKKFVEAGGEIVYGTAYFDDIEVLPEPARDFIRNLQMSLEGERHREAWRQQKLQRFESALQESGHAVR